MRVAIRLLTLALAAIAFATGASSVLSGLPGAPEAVLDNTFRFYAGIWFAMGFGLLHAALAFERTEHMFAFLMRALIIGGVARAVGLLDVPAQGPIVLAIVIEIGLPLLLLGLRARLPAVPQS